MLSTLGRVVVYIGKSGKGTDIVKAGAAVLTTVAAAFGIGYVVGKKGKKSETKK